MSGSFLSYMSGLYDEWFPIDRELLFRERAWRHDSMEVIDVMAESDSDLQRIRYIDRMRLWYNYIPTRKLQ